MRRVTVDVEEDPGVAATANCHGGLGTAATIPIAISSVKQRAYQMRTLAGSRQWKRIPWLEPAPSCAERVCAAAQMAAPSGEALAGGSTRIAAEEAQGWLQPFIRRQCVGLKSRTVECRTGDGWK